MRRIQAIYQKLLGPFKKKRLQPTEVLQNAGKNHALFLADANLATFHLYFAAPLKQEGNTEWGYSLLTHESFDSQRVDDAKVSELFDQIKPTALILTRFGREAGHLFIEKAKADGIPVAYHIDDDLLEPPQSLGSEIAVRHGKDIVTRQRLIEAADVVWASTSYLAAVLSKKFPKKMIHCGPSAPFPDRPFPHPKALGIRPFTIGYMGSKGHQRDLQMIEPALIKLLERHSDLRFETFGSIQMPQAILEKFPDQQKAWPSVAGYERFLDALTQKNWNLGIAPLIDDKFNRCKTMIKFLEYAWAGIPVVASHSVVYEEPAQNRLLLSSDPGSWEQKLEAAFSSDLDFASMVKEAREYCREHYSLARTQTELLQLLKKLN